MTHSAFASDPRIGRQRHLLADGRELIYFDDPDTSLPPDRSPDLREPAPRPPTAAMRQDALTGEWVSVAAARQNRAFLPESPRSAGAVDAGEPVGDPRQLRRGRVREQVAVVRPRAAGRGGADGARRPRPECGLFGRERAPRSAAARSCASARSTRGRSRASPPPGRAPSLRRGPSARPRPVPDARRRAGLPVREPGRGDRRDPAASARPDLRLPLCDAAHAAPARTALNRYGPNLFADILASEQAGPRVILSGEHWTAFVPFAARWPIEVHMLPHRHLPDFAATSLAERDELAVLYRDLLRGDRRHLRHPDALYRRVAPGSRAGGPCRGAPHAPAHQPAPRRRPAQIPGRVGGRDGRLDR